MEKKHLSQKKLDEILRKENSTLGQIGVPSKIESVRNEIPSTDKRTVFLSHSHLNKTILKRVGLLFSKLGAGIYIDWMDKSLPEVRSYETAAAIKEKIRSCHRFLFLATYRGLQSKWCNWKLGIAHSLKEERELAVLPIESRSGNWKETEYLQLYPEMNFESDDMERVSAGDVQITVNGIKTPLISWLNA